MAAVGVPADSTLAMGVVCGVAMRRGFLTVEVVVERAPFFAAAFTTVLFVFPVVGRVVFVVFSAILASLAARDPRRNAGKYHHARQDKYSHDDHDDETCVGGRVECAYGLFARSNVDQIFLFRCPIH